MIKITVASIDAKIQPEGQKIVLSQPDISFSKACIMKKKQKKHYFNAYKNQTSLNQSESKPGLQLFESKNLP